MKIIVIANESQASALCREYQPAPGSFSLVSSLKDVKPLQEADVVIDLLFDENPDHLEILRTLKGKLIIINSVIYTLAETEKSFVRINGWNGFLEKNILEASANAESRLDASGALAVFNKTPEWVPDSTGFVSPRVICMIINEAYLALKEGVSTKDQINTAMKLGTNYPFGPFEWAEKIGVYKVTALLTKLSSFNPKYSPAENLVVK